MSMMGRLNMKLQEDAEEFGFSTVQEALDAGYEVVGEKLYLPIDKTFYQPREDALDMLDEVISYLKAQCNDEECGVETYMIGNLREVEKYIKEN